MGNIFSISLDETFSHCLDCSVGEAEYIWKLEQNISALQTALEKLIERKDDVKTRITIAEQQQMKRLNQVQGWLSRVHTVENEVTRLLTESSQEMERLCLGGFCSKNCKVSHSFGKEVKAKMQVVAELIDEGAFSVVAEKIPVAIVDERPIDPTIVGMELIFQEVWRCIRERNVGIIGLYGMGGVGKTTLLTQINNMFIDMSEGYDFVLWVVVSKDLQLEKIQEKIGRKIGLTEDSWKYQSLEEKALDIYKILSKKRFVLLLDDIWERVDLTKAGVPLPGAKINSKIVFTTRFDNVCGSMEAHQKFKVDCLPHDEAWKLFQLKVGRDTIESHPHIPELADMVAKECAGLPLALITIGRAMACKKTPQEWEYAIQVLRQSASEFPGMGREVYPLLKFSYDSLPSEKIRSCFLYCSLFPEDCRISKRFLIDYWIGEGFLDGYNKGGVQNQGYYILGVLVHACLLEEDDDCVKMHDVLRDMSLWIACEIEEEKESFVVHAGSGLTEVPINLEWKKVRRLSLMENNIEHSPSKTPRCPCLLSLFLNYNNLEKINSDFFQSMPSLKVLSLSYNPLTELPSTVPTLVSLTHLDLSETMIKKFPKELKALVNLKCLNLEHTSNLHTVPQKLISNFSMLHVLRMFNCGFVFQTKDSVLQGGGTILIKELIGLKHLNVLSITLKSNEALQRCLSSEKLQSCIQSLVLQRFEDANVLNILSLSNMKNLDALYIWNCKLLEELKIESSREAQTIRGTRSFNNLHTFNIDLCLKLRDLTWLVLAVNLKIIQITNCYEMEEIISAEKLEEVSEPVKNQILFAELRSLTLRNLRKLKSICPNALPFPLLKELKVVECPKLKKLPLGSNSTKDHNIVIEGEENWWRELEWSDQATHDAFSLCFRSF